MKKVLGIALMLAFLVPAGALADCKDEKTCDLAHAKYIDKKVQKLTKKLSLTEDQQGKVRSALEKKMEAKAAIHQEVHTKLKSVTETFDSDMKGILDDAQEKKFEKLMAKSRSKGDDCKECMESGSCPHKK